MPSSCPPENLPISARVAGSAGGSGRFGNQGGLYPPGPPFRTAVMLGICRAAGRASRGRHHHDALGSNIIGLSPERGDRLPTRTGRCNCPPVLPFRDDGTTDQLAGRGPGRVDSPVIVAAGGIIQGGTQRQNAVPTPGTSHGLCPDSSIASRSSPDGSSIAIGVAPPGSSLSLIGWRVARHLWEPSV